jgi:propionyl-CoA carboxylase alpha chain
MQGKEPVSVKTLPGGMDGEVWVKIGDDPEVPVYSDWVMDSCVVKAEMGDSDAETSVQCLGKTTTGFKIAQHGTVYDVQVMAGAAAELMRHMPIPVEIDHSKYVIAPLSGTIKGLSVQPGDVIVEGAEVAVLEAMKMLNVLRAPRSGTIKSVNYTEGDTVEVDQFIVEFEAN